MSRRVDMSEVRKSTEVQTIERCFRTVEVQTIERCFCMVEVDSVDLTDRASCFTRRTLAHSPSAQDSLVCKLCDLF